MIVRLVMFALGFALGICALGPLMQGLFVYTHGSVEAQLSIFAAVGLVIVSAVLLITYRFLESRSPITIRRY